AGGAWGLVVRRILEAATRTLPLLALLFVPVWIGVRDVYLWAAPGDDPLHHARAYLNVPFFRVRALIYFGAWLGCAYIFNKWSRERDTRPDPNPRRFRLFAGPGLALYGLTVTFAAIDWAMSLEPHWYSTIYPAGFGVGQVLSAFAFGIAAAVLRMRLVALLWLLVPGFHRPGFALRWLDLVAPIGFGGIWLWAFLFELRGRPLVPQNDPDVEEALAHAH